MQTHIIKKRGKKIEIISKPLRQSALETGPGSSLVRNVKNCKKTSLAWNKSLRKYLFNYLFNSTIEDNYW